MPPEPLDLRALSAEDAARALFAFVCNIARDDGQDPNIECSLLDPRKSKSAGYGPFWTVSWEAGPHEWGVLLSLGESMWVSEHELPYDHQPEVLLNANHWYVEPYYSFNLGFIVEVPEFGFDVDRDDGSGRSIVTVSGLVGEALIKYFDRYPERLRIIDRRKFEELITELFSGFGYDVELTRPTRDGGKDIIAVKRIDDIKCWRARISDIGRVVGRNSDRAQAQSTMSFSAYWYGTSTGTALLLARFNSIVPAYRVWVMCQAVI